MLSFPMFAAAPLHLKLQRSSLQLLAVLYLTVLCLTKCSFSLAWRLFARSLVLLALFFDALSFVFSNLQPLLSKQGGCGVPLG